MPLLLMAVLFFLLPVSPLAKMSVPLIDWSEKRNDACVGMCQVGKLQSPAFIVGEEAMIGQSHVMFMTDGTRRPLVNLIE